MTGSRRKVLLIGVSACGSGFLPGGWRAFGGSARPAVNVDADNVAISGYDTVAYFTDGKPVKGSPEFEQVWLGAKWRFASAAHRDLFSRRPEAYAPRFGGFCAMALTAGTILKSDPEAWAIIDDKLYLNFDEKTAAIWQMDAADNDQKAEQHWNALGQ